jgi:predicted RNase H-like nuclease (RuvC/YqgF family)
MGPNPNKDTLQDYDNFIVEQQELIKSLEDKVKLKESEIKDIKSRISIIDIEIKKTTIKFNPFLKLREKEQDKNNIVGLQKIYKENKNAYKQIMRNKNNLNRQ